ncbi:hypothetical protein T265_02492 [Opisthorchis viverrini]|uniref:Uncharacterized protein n=1 Tax=Opisthorchis viverrini TaxID=6198 RepID=A0A074ZUR0_OPIVI|nr:hypothetical protein T265_02492 [Opisthorchis viverrini]KER31163.1 hypothetical protein T265_02492 [Opisthorchis viverrini]
MSQPTQLLVLDTFFNGSTRYTTENTLSNCLVTDSPTPTHASYGSETTIVEHLKTSQVRCSNRPILTAIQQNSPYCSSIHTCLKLANANRALQVHAFTSSVTLHSELIQLPRYVKRSTTSSASPWIVSGVFSDCTSTSMTLHFVGAKCIPKDGMTLVSLDLLGLDWINELRLLDEPLSAVCDKTTANGPDTPTRTSPPDDFVIATVTAKPETRWSIRDTANI